MGLPSTIAYENKEVGKTASQVESTKEIDKGIRESADLEVIVSCKKDRDRGPQDANITHSMRALPRHRSLGLGGHSIFRSVNGA
jgi:hypothetical protein